MNRAGDYALAFAAVPHVQDNVGLKLEFLSSHSIRIAETDFCVLRDLAKFLT